MDSGEFGVVKLISAIKYFQRCDQRVDVAARPLQIVYDAETIIQLLQVFKLPKDANLSE